MLKKKNKVFWFYSFVSLIVIAGCASFTKIEIKSRKSYDEVFSVVKDVITTQGFEIIELDNKKGFLKTDWKARNTLSLEEDQRRTMLEATIVPREYGFEIGVRTINQVEYVQSTSWSDAERDIQMEDKILYIIKLRLTEVKDE